MAPAVGGGPDPGVEAELSPLSGDGQPEKEA